MELNDLQQRVWALLDEGVRSASSPFHTPALATLGEEGPEVRTVVLRSADPDRRHISCHTDWRSPKRRQIDRDSRVSWLFYDPARKIQIRLWGRALVHRRDDLSRERWHASPARSRVCYSTPVAPGEPVPAPMPAPEERLDAFDDFAVVECRVASVDWLFLQAAGHERARLTWVEGSWELGWVAP